MIFNIFTFLSLCTSSAFSHAGTRYFVYDSAGESALTDVFQSGCSPISTLSCNDIKVDLPYNLNFDAAVNNSISDKNGNGTGFTTVNNYSGTRLSADGNVTNPSVPGYEQSKITLSGGRLQLVTGKGIDYQTNNNQLNILGVQIATVKKLQLDVKVINPYNGTQSQQAGLWYGLNDKTFVKLTITGNKVELRREINNATSTASGTGNPDQRITAVISGLNGQTVRLRMVVDSVTNTVEGFYSTDGVTYKSAGTAYPSPGLSIAGTGLATGNVYAGIYATHRNGTTAVSYNFDDFSAQAVTVPVAPEPTTVNINFQPANATVPAGYTPDTGLPYNASRKFGWIDPDSKQPVDLQANMRLRTGSGDLRQLSLVQMQDATKGQVPGTWEHAVANGLYRVTVSAGDNGYYDSNHQINIEGLPAIADFNGSSSNKFRTATAVVQVSDGKLTLDASGGVNSKMNYVTFGPASSVTDAAKPTASARFAGTLKSPNTYDSRVQIFLTAADAGASGLASFQYSINNGSYIDYKAPFSITTAGNYTLTVKAVDGNGNQFITNQYNFSIEMQVVPPSNGAYMVIKNLDLFPSDDRLVFSLIQTPWRRTSPDTTPYNANHDKVKFRVNNKGTGKLTLANLRFSNPAAWKIVSIGSDLTAALPVSVNSKASVDITVQFIAKDAATRLKVFQDTLIITSNDSISPSKRINLAGIWQKAGEGVNEPYAQQIISAFGFASNVGYNSNDGNNKGTVKVPNSSEINASYFVKADNSKPVTVYQLAAYHGCCSAVESIRYFRKGSSSNLNIFTHNNLDGQSLSPRRTGSSTALAQGTFDPTSAFGIRVGSSSSDRTQNFEGLIGIRFLKVFDSNGNIVPNAYLLNCDYLGTSFTNYDYQDNIYYIENIRPDSGTVFYSELASEPVTAVNFAATQTGATTTVPINLRNTGMTYPNGSSDPAIQLKSVQIVGPNASEFSTGSFTASSLAVQATKAVSVRFTPTSVGIKNAALLVNYNNAQSPLRIPLYGIANSSSSTVNVVKRIKGGVDVNMTIGNILYENDKTYRKGSIKLDKQITLGAIKSTDVDSLYQTYLSAATDLAETRYEIPVPNGNYLIRMHFVENYWSATGSRVFNTRIEEQLVSSNFDIYREVGYRSALVKDFAATVNDGVLNVRFNPIANRVAIAALEIFQVRDVSALTTNSVNNTAAVMRTSTASGERQIMAYPNPNTGSVFNLNLSNLAKNEKGVVSITNTWGRLIQTQDFVTDINGNVNLQLTFNTILSKGVYMINVQSPSGKLYSKLLVE